MQLFWLGYLAAVVSYLVIGFCIGCYVVVTHLARFHSGGFQWRRMAGHIAMMAMLERPER